MQTDFRSSKKNAVISSSEAAASISDSTGQLLFYTDGVTIWNRFHGLMKNGDSLKGHHSSVQGVIILPHTTQKSLYYVLTSACRTMSPYSTGLYYSLVDMNLDNKKGAVIEKNIPIAREDISEALTAVPDCSGKGYWILTHAIKNNKFYSFRLTEKGFDTIPVVSQFTTNDPPSEEYFGTRIKVSPDGKNLLLTERARPSIVALYNFDYTNGEVSNKRALTFPAPNDMYSGGSFSPDNSKVYVVQEAPRKNNYIRLIQWEVSDEADYLVRATGVEMLFSFPSTMYLRNANAMSLAPDGKLYFTQESFLAVIENPNEKGEACNLKEFAIELQGTTTWGSLPNFPDFFFEKKKSGRQVFICAPPMARFTPDTICAGNTIEYRDTSDNLPDEWKWIFEGGQPLEFHGDFPPPIFYKEAGSFKTTLIVRNNFGSDTLIQTVSVHPLPTADAASDITLCGSATSQLGTPAIAGNTYRWTPSIGLDNPNIAQPRVKPIEPFQKYFLKVTNEFGCEATDSVTVSLGEVKVNVRDTSFCRGSAIVLKASGGSEYEWSPPDGLASTTDASVLASPFITTTYQVIARSGDCRDTAFLKVEVLNLPVADAGSDKEICVGESVELGAASSEPGLKYQWTPSEGLLKTDVSNPIASPLQTTEYIVEVINESGCIGRDTVLVTVSNLLKLTAANDTSVCAGESVELWAVSDEPGVTYTWTPETGLDNSNIANPTATPTQTTIYTVTAFKNGGLCSAVDSVRIEVLKLPEVTTKDITLCEGESGELWAESDEPVVTWNWTPATGLSNPNIQNPIVTAFKSQVYTVTATNKSGCTAFKTLSVTVTEKEDITGVLKAEKSELEPGESTTVKLLLKAENSAGITSFKALVHFDANVFQLTKNSGKFLNGADNTWFLKAEITAPGELEIEANGQTPIASSELAFELTAYLAKQTSENILLKLIEINGEVLKEEELCRTIETEGAKLVLKEVCAGDMRLVNVGEFQTALQQITPNPVTNETIEINYSVGIDGNIALEIYNSQGELVKTIFKGNHKAGVFKEMVSTEKFPAGVFLVKLSTQQATATRMFTMVK